jgi:hypothetical protein
MKIKNVNIYCNPQAQCPVIEFMNQLTLSGQTLLFHKLAMVRVGIYTECIALEENICAIRFHENNKELAFYFGIGLSNIILLNAGLAKNHEKDSKKALLYWKDYKRTNYKQDYLNFNEELFKKLQDKSFTIEYLKSTIVDPQKKLFILALKDLLQAHLIENSDITFKTKLNTQKLAQLLMKKNAAKVLTLPDILTALSLYLAVHSIK